MTRNSPTGHTVVVADLDGTLAFDGRPPTAEITALLKAIADAPSARLVIATSRSPRSLRVWFGALADQIDLICCNGALVTGPGIDGQRRPLSTDLVAAMVGELRAARENFCLEYGDHFMASSADALPWMGRRDRTVLRRHEAPSLDGVLKLSVAHADPWGPRLRSLSDGRAEVFAHLTGDADVVAAGVTKGRALRRLLDGAPGQRPAVVAFGNDTNDLEMLRSADEAVLVGTGLPGLERLPHVRRVLGDDHVVAEELRFALAMTVRSPVPFGT